MSIPTNNLGLSKTVLLATPATTNANLDAIDAALGNIENRTTDTSAPIVSKQGTVFLSKGSAGAWTLAVPTAGLPSAGGDDGKVLRFIATTAFAHTVTTPASGIDGSLHIATWTAAVGNSLELVAFNAVWYRLTVTGVTLS
jgi:hypothetical protein